jgi:biotin carboxyl carrier protein
MALEPSFKASVNEAEYTFENVQTEALDLVELGQGRYHVIKGHQSYRVEVLQLEFAAKAFQVKINGAVYQVKLQDEYDQLIQRLGLAAVASEKIREVKAPMPGLVLALSVEEGQAVEKGQPLLILEAMKMENVIKSPGDGIVKRINVKKGEPVEKNYLLVELD